MGNRSLGRFINVAWLATLAVVSGNAQLTLTGTNYTENFNNLDAGLPVGWMVCTNAHATNVGTAVNFVTTHASWANTTGQFQNSAGTGNAGTNLLGTESSTVQSGYTNRAPAIRQTAGFGDPGAAFVLNLTNTMGMAGFQLDLDLLMLGVQNHATVWTVDYAVGNNPANFVALATYNDPGAFGATHTNISFGTALDNQSSNVWIRVAALSASTGSTGSRDTFGIDNFSLSWTSITPLTITSIVITNGNVQIDFTAAPDDVPAAFFLFGSPQAGGPYADAGATITSLGSGLFRAVSALNGPQQFYYVQRL
jgi:hypothetical protein